jgi:hypothetical protein
MIPRTGPGAGRVVRWLPVPGDLASYLDLMADDPTASRPRPVRRRFAQLLDAVERTGARYALCGAVAMAAHGVRRFTEDIDVLVNEADLGPLLAALARSFREVGREPAEGPPAQVRLRARRAPGPEAVDVDLLVPVDAAEAWALATAVRARAFGRKVDVASVEALVVLKLRAYLSDPESASGGQHRADAIRLVHGARPDVAGLRRFVCSDARLAAELDRALAAPPARGRGRR